MSEDTSDAKIAGRAHDGLTELNEFTQDEWREVARAVRPDITDDGFDEMWSGFVEMKRRKELQ